MARRGRKKKFKLNLKLDIRPDLVKSVLSITLILLGVLSLISFFAPNHTVNEKIQEILLELFGSPAIVMPFILVLAGLLLIDSIKFKYKELRVLLGLVGILLSLSGLFAIFKWSGGVVGTKIGDTLSDAISAVAAALVLLGAFIVSLLLVLDVSLNQIFAFISRIFEKIKKFVQKHTKAKGDKKDDVIVTTGMDLPEETVTQETSQKEPLPEPSFELVPPLSEPLVNGNSSVLETSGGALTSISPRLPYSDKVWEYPPLDLLADQPSTPPDVGNVKARAKIIVDTLKSFGINVDVVNIQPGPSVTQYALKAATGTKISKISALQYDLALALASPTGSVRIEAPIPGKSLIGIEVPNNNRVIVNFKSLLKSESMKALKSKLGIVLGKNVGGNTVVYDVGKMPHLLVAGATGSGKSVFLHSAIFSMLYRASPQECKFILIDPKRVELVHYKEIPHLLTPVVTDTEKAPAVFKWAVVEMERRYKLFESAKARNIDAYNEKSGFQALPYIVIIVDELGEIMVSDPASVEKSIIRIAQLARATGIHLILSVQRPSTNVITGLIKANIPCRVAFNVSSQVDSRVIIDQQGAEKLLGKGDMLFVPPDVAKPLRLQGAFVSDREIANLVNYLKAQGVPPDYKDEILSVPSADAEKSIAAGGEAVDELFDDAVEEVIAAGKGSASFLQRRLSIGYARAARILDELEEKGIVGPPQGSKPREVLKKSAPHPLDAGGSDVDTPAPFPEVS